MEAINKNKEEIEKILEELKKDIYSGRSFLNCLLQATIKTSILWCEDEIDYLTRFVNLCDYTCYSMGNLDPNERIQQIQTHLNWLKEQEKQ